MSEILFLALAIVFIVAATTLGKLHPFIALILAAFGYGFGVGMPANDLIESINRGFGDTIAYIGIVILAGSIIGTFLSRSGGASLLAERIVTAVGPRRGPVSMGLIGYIISMPVFCDVAYVLLSPVNSALATKARANIAVGAVALALGLYATHTMVPPTPGPVAAAGILLADLGLVIAWGLLVSATALLGGLAFAARFAASVSLKPLQAPSNDDLVDRPPPRLGLTVLPIFVPIALIVLRSISQLPSRPLGESTIAQASQFVGQPAVALLIGVAFALLLPHRPSRELMSEKGWAGEAVRNAALIIIVTGAGGAFGRVLQESGIAEVVGGVAISPQIGLLLPFIIAAIIKTAQGSSTVAIITTAGIVSTLLPSLGLDSDQGRALAVVAIGAGSMVVSHANDSYFWVVTQFSGMSVRQGYQLHTLGTLVQGLCALLILGLIGFLLF